MTDAVEVADPRSFADSTTASWEPAELADTVALLVSELVTNALVHTEGPATLELRRQRGPDLRAGHRRAHPAAPDPARRRDATGGRGMVLVDALATKWGVEPSGAGRTVWAEMRTA